MANQTKQEHTQGPWSIEFSDTGGYDCMTGAWHIRSGKKTIAEVDQSSYGQNHCDYDWRSDEAEANARLIAEAPAMLLAMKDLALELEQIHAHYQKTCHGGCPSLAYIQTAKDIIKRIERD